MTKITQLLAKEIGALLTSYRRKSHLSQSELANRIGLSAKSGKISISHLEKGKFKKLSLDLVLNYLTVCEQSWSAFFEKLSGIYFTKQHEKVMAQVPTSKLFKKVNRDVAKYAHSIDTKFSKKQNIKPIRQEQKEKMSAEFGKYRANIEDIEREVTLLLGNSGEPPVYNQFYKAFARQYYSFYRKQNLQKINTNKRKVNIINLDKKIADWVNRGLKKEILDKIVVIVDKHIIDKENKFES